MDKSSFSPPDSDHQPCPDGGPPSAVIVAPRQTTLAPLNAVDLFAGAGGFSAAASKVGIRVVAAVEMDKFACATYRGNLIGGSGDPDAAPRLYATDILALEPEALREAHFADGATCDLVLGGPPCQGFSVHRINDAGVGDPRNKLLLRYFKFVKCLQPRIFLMENVPGLLWPRHRDFLQDFLRESRHAGYRILGPDRLDARDYGVPQRRKRIFLLGIRGDVTFDAAAWPPPATHGDAKACAEDPSLNPWISAAAVFGLPAPEGDENDLHMNHSPELVRVFEATPLNGGSRRNSGRVLPCHDDHNGHSDVYGRIDPAAPGPTMTTACINPSKGRFVHPTEPHGITVRQAARFQTFPDTFVFKGGLMAAGAQIGNAVPVLLGEVLLRAVSRGLGVDPDA